jgi:hypothetical protein
MRRLFWLGIGVAVGVVVVRQIGKAAQAYSPSGLAGTARKSATGILDSVRDFVSDVRDGMSEREAEIAAAFEQGVSLDDLDEARYDEARHDEARHDEARYDGNGHRDQRDSY